MRGSFWSQQELRWEHALVGTIRQGAKDAGGASHASWGAVGGYSSSSKAAVCDRSMSRRRSRVGAGRRGKLTSEAVGISGRLSHYATRELILGRASISSERGNDVKTIEAPQGCVYGFSDSCRLPGNESPPFLRVERQLRAIAADMSIHRASAR